MHRRIFALIFVVMVASVGMGIWWNAQGQTLPPAPIFLPVISHSGYLVSTATPTPTNTPTPTLTPTVPNTATSTATATATPTDTAVPTVPTLTPTVTSVVVVSDNFNDNTINSSIWDIGILSNDSTIEEINQRLEIVHGADARDVPGKGVFFAQYLSRCVLSGDFDMQVTYHLLTWPASNGVRVGLSIGIDREYIVNFPMERLNTGSGNVEAYVADFYGVNGFFPTQDVTGKLRLTRLGDLLTGYYYKADNWIPIHTRSIPTVDMYFAIASWSHTQIYGKQETKIAFDDFSINSGTLVCP